MIPCRWYTLRSDVDLRHLCVGVSCSGPHVITDGVCQCKTCNRNCSDIDCGVHGSCQAGAGWQAADPCRATILNHTTNKYYVCDGYCAKPGGHCDNFNDGRTSPTCLADDFFGQISQENSIYSYGKGCGPAVCVCSDGFIGNTCQSRVSSCGESHCESQQNCKASGRSLCYLVLNMPHRRSRPLAEPSYSLRAI